MSPKKRAQALSEQLQNLSKVVLTASEIMPGK
jgi:hypothetical protein